MADYTNETEGCAHKVVYAIDVLDEEHALLSESIPLSATLGDCGCGPQKCQILESWVNKKRAQVGKDPLEGGSITPESTITEVIDHVCA
jgi:hypothetical protein